MTVKRVALSRGLAGLFKGWTSLCDSEVGASRVVPSQRVLEFRGPARKLPPAGPSVDAAYRGLRGDGVKDARLGIGPRCRARMTACGRVDKANPGTPRCKRSDMTVWIVLFLFKCVFLLATLGSCLETWYSRAKRPRRPSPRPTDVELQCLAFLATDRGICETSANTQSTAILFAGPIL